MAIGVSFVFLTMEGPKIPWEGQNLGIQSNNACTYVLNRSCWLGLLNLGWGWYPSMRRRCLHLVAICNWSSFCVRRYRCRNLRRNRKLQCQEHFETSKFKYYRRSFIQAKDGLKSESSGEFLHCPKRCQKPSWTIRSSK